MKFRVIVTDGALADLAEIDDFIVTNDSIDSADHVIDNLEQTVQRLADLPNRGHFPRELAALGIQDYREVDWTNYRIIYRVDGQKVYVYVISSARRDFQALLQRRLLLQ